MTGLVAEMPQYVTDVSVIGLVVSVVITALPALITGRNSVRPNWPARRVRVSASLILAIAAAFALVVVFVLSPKQHDGHWGSSDSLIAMAVWLSIIAALTARNVLREWRYVHGDPTAQHDDRRSAT